MPGFALSPEGRRIFGDMSVEDNLKVGGFNTRHRRLLEQRLDNVYGWIPLLYQRRKSFAGSLSGGQQEMLAMGRALMRDPHTLLLDEPTLGLSPKAAFEIASLIQRVGESGTTVAIVEQDASMALGLADYTYVLQVGRIVLQGDADKIRGDTSIQKAYLGTE